MEESMKTVLSNQIFENKKRKQNKKELFWINAIIGIIALVSFLIALAIILFKVPGIKASPFAVVAGFLFITDVIIILVKSDAKSTFLEVKDPTEEEIIELAKEYLKDYEKSLENKPQELKKIELDIEAKMMKHKEGVLSTKAKIKELKEIMGIPETD